MLFFPPKIDINSCAERDPKQVLPILQACHAQEALVAMTVNVDLVAMTALYERQVQQIGEYSRYITLHQINFFLSNADSNRLSEMLLIIQNIKVLCLPIHISNTLKTLIACVAHKKRKEAQLLLTMMKDIHSIHSTNWSFLFSLLIKKCYEYKEQKSLKQSLEIVIKHNIRINVDLFPVFCKLFHSYIIPQPLFVYQLWNVIENSFYPVMIKGLRDILIKKLATSGNYDESFLLFQKGMEFGTLVGRDSYRILIVECYKEKKFQMMYLILDLLHKKCRHRVIVELMNFFIYQKQIYKSFYIFKIAMDNDMQLIGTMINADFLQAVFGLLRQTLNKNLDECSKYIVQTLDTCDYQFSNKAMHDLIDKDESEIATKLLRIIFQDNRFRLHISKERKEEASSALFMYLLDKKKFDEAQQIFEMTSEQDISIQPNLVRQLEEAKAAATQLREADNAETLVEIHSPKPCDIFSLFSNDFIMRMKVPPIVTGEEHADSAETLATTVDS